MPRKFAFKQKKRYYIKRTPTESIPSSSTSPDLVVSIPLENYIQAPVDSVSSLIYRIHSTGFTFPPGWVNISSEISELVVSQIDTSGLEPVSVITIRVADNLSWTLSVLGKRLAMPDVFHSHEHIRSVATLATILSILLSYQVCKGNPEEDYVSLCKLRKNNFHDITGTRAHLFVFDMTILYSV